MLPFVRVSLNAVCACALLASTGCGLSHFSDPSSATLAIPQISGNVHGGQQPIYNSNIYLYESNATTLKGASTLLNALTPVTTDANGNFTITGQYVCSSPTTLLYIVAAGGNPGLAAGTTNTSAVEMALLGNCSSIFLNALTTYININELTTVAAAEAAAAFMADYAHFGATSAAALAGVFSSANGVVSFATGQFVTPPSGATLPIALYDTLANILASCVNSTGNTGSTTNCGKLSTATASAPDTDGSILYIAQHPATSVATLYALAAASAPFQPTLAAQPTDFTTSTASGPIVSIYSGTNYLPNFITIDGAQNVWVATAAPRLSTAANLFVLDNNLQPLRQFALSAQIFNLSTDKAGNVWVLTGTNSGNTAKVFKYDSGGNVIINGVSTMSSDSNAVYPSGSQMSFDTAGNAWVTAFQLNTGYACGEKLSGTTGAVLATRCFSTSTSSSGVTYGGITTDSSDNVYLSATQASVIFKFDDNGTVNTTTPFTANGLPLSGASGKLRFDPANSRIVMNTNGGSFQVFSTSGATVNSNISSPNGILSPATFALDGLGNIWYVNFTLPSTVGGVTQAGVFLSPTTSVHGFAPPNADYDTQIQIDAAGNIFLCNNSLAGATAGSVLKVPGLATGKNQQNY
jgi:hypothetical protein